MVKSKMLSGVAGGHQTHTTIAIVGLLLTRSSGPGTTEVILVADEFGGLLRTRAGKRFITQLVVHQHGTSFV